MQVAFLASLLFATALAVGAEEIQSNIQPVVGQQQHHHQGQLAPVQVHSVAPVVGEQQPQIVHHVVHQPAAVAEQHHAHDGHPHHAHEGHFAQDGHTHDHPSQPQHQQPQYAAPSGLIQLVGPQQYSNAAVVGQAAGNAVSGPVASSEQYGKPESASIPPNYKPFGSWGLYIGGNPADGYYSNYYKALGSSVADKQQVGAPADKPQQAGGPSSQISAFGPILKQASSYPYSSGASYADQVYPFDYYTPADLNSGSRVAVLDQSGPSSYAAGIASPVSIGSQVYGAPLTSVYSHGVEQPALAYVDAYSTKRLGSLTPSVAKGQHQERVQPQQQQQVEVPAKGYQARYAYVQSPMQYQQQQQHHHYAAGHVAAGPQVVAYPVPVGSQIIGSQPDTEGSYTPYGVHGYTRYAVKPTVVASSEQQYYHQGVHSAPIAHFPAYKQQSVAHSVAYQPLGFYGYPLNQLHYSQGSIVPAFNQYSSIAPTSSSSSSSGVSSVDSAAASPVAPAGVESPVVEAASSEKSETKAAVTSVAKEAKSEKKTE